MTLMSTPSARPPARIRPRTVAALVIGMTLGSAGLNVMPVLVEDFTARFQMSDAESGLVAAAQLLATAVTTLLAASRAARPGRARLARRALPVVALGSVGAFGADDRVTLVLANLLLGVGLGVLYAVTSAAVATTDDPDRASSVSVVGTVLVAAFLITAVSILNIEWGAGTGFLLLGVMCLPAWFLVGHLPDSASAQVRPASSGAGSPSPAALRSTPSVSLLLGTATLWAVTQGAWSYGSVLGRTRTGMSTATVSTVLAVSSVVALAGAVSGPILARRLGRLPTMAGFVVVQALAIWALAATHDQVVFTGAAVVWQACQLAVLVQSMGAAAFVDPTGRQVAALSGAAALGTAAGPLVVGLVLDGPGVGPLSILLATGTVVASLPLVRLAAAAVPQPSQALPATVIGPAGGTSHRPSGSIDSVTGTGIARMSTWHMSLQRSAGPSSSEPPST